jgi:hypothetical protein
MALTDENGGNFNVSMPVQPMGGGYGGYSYPMAYPVMPYSGGFGGGFGDNLGGDWIILFLFAMMFGGGWGGMGGFGGWGGGFGGMWGGGFGGGGMMSFGGENVSIVDFMIKRFEVIKNAIG